MVSSNRPPPSPTARPSTGETSWARSATTTYDQPSAVDSKGFFHVNGTDILGNGDISFGLFLDWGHTLMRTANEDKPLGAADDPVDDDGQKGAIVNMASAAAFDGQIGQCAYSASKGGIVGMTLPIARDLSAVGVRVNTIAPGLIDTPIYGEGEASEQFKAHLGQSVLFPKRLGSGEELAFMVMDLITNPYMNAETIRVDGGIRMPPK